MNFWEADPVAPAAANSNFWEADPVAPTASSPPAPGDMTPNERVYSGFQPLANPAYAGLKGRPFIPNEQRGTEAAGLLKSLATGTARGAEYTAGLPGDFQRLTGLLGDKLTEKLGLDTPENIAALRAKVDKSPFALPTAQNIVDAETSVTGGLHKAQNRAEQMTENLGSLLGPAMLTRGNAVANTARFAALPTAAAEGAGELAHGTKIPDFVPGVGGQDAEPWARGIASVIAPALAPRVISPIRAANPTRVQNVDALAAEGVPTTAGQRTGSTRLLQWEGDLAPGRNEEQAAAFTRAAGRRVGLDSDYLTTGPDGNFTNRLNQIQGRFDTLGQQGTLRADPGLVADLQNAHDSVNAIPGIHAPAAITAARGAIQSVSDALHATGGTIAGADYQTLRSRLNTAAMNAENPSHAGVLRDVVEGLDDAFERSNPRLAGQFGEARRDYRNALVLEDALSKRGTAGGTISASQLASSAQKVYGRRTYLKGQDDFSDLARPGEAVLGSIPNSSNTAHYGRINSIISALGAAGGYGVGHMMGHGVEGGVGGLLLGHDSLAPLIEPVVRAGLRRAVMNPLSQLYLGNQAAARAPRALQTIPGLLAPLEATRGAGN